ncbi:2'-5' RNA ligase family protein [Arenimonas composti]|uniref:RNA 2',3'-cyclic 3'-phosphodiesterase n=1 Tax=Arenimonas composti TR7-09 = DSM 18010 TaxID=1121013 RepID=A0A091BBQ2_9GAMM|nr:2'-5' RNA ligase family protein [Arenimonas composti]KFN48264.1 hypothetical protein P873_01525 [Arenimonas composti TR7-09 = DSM 18010]
MVTQHAGVSRPAGAFAFDGTGGGDERLFFALFPPPVIATGLVELGRRLRERHGLSGAVAPAERMHVTLAFVGSFRPVPPDLIGAAKTAGDLVSAAPVPVAFALAGSFDGRGGRHPFVLRGGELAALHDLRRQLCAALVATRAIASTADYEPHLTLLCDRKLVATEALAAPPWQATTFSLVLSTAAGYRSLQTWPLQA